MDGGGERQREGGAARARLERRGALPELRFVSVSSSFSSSRFDDPGPSFLDPDAHGAVVGGDGEGLAELGVRPGELLFWRFEFFF